MKAIDAIRFSLEMTGGATRAIVEDMRNAPLTQPTPQLERKGNHPIWILGHLAFTEGSLPGILFGDAENPNPLQAWAPLFAPGSEPTPQASRYPSFDEVLEKYTRFRDQTLRLLDESGEAGLDRTPESIPAGFEEEMKTFGRTFQVIALHNMVHYGQIADARRVAGRRPLL